MNKEQIIALALKTAKQNGCNKFHATKDGNIFRANAKGEPSNTCLNHQKVCKGDLLDIEFSDDDLKGKEPAKETKAVKTAAKKTEPANETTEGGDSSNGADTTNDDANTAADSKPAAVKKVVAPKKKAAAPKQK